MIPSGWDGQSAPQCHQKAVIAASHGVDRLGRQVDELSRRLDRTEVRLLEVGGGWWVVGVGLNSKASVNLKFFVVTIEVKKMKLICPH